MSLSSELDLLIGEYKKFALPSFLFDDNSINSSIGIMMELVLSDAIDGMNLELSGDFNVFPDLQYLDLLKIEVKAIRDDHKGKGVSNPNFNTKKDSIDKKILKRENFPNFGFRLLVVNWMTVPMEGIGEEIMETEHAESFKGRSVRDMSRIRINRIRVFDLEPVLDGRIKTSKRQQVISLMNKLEDFKTYDSLESE